MLTKYFVLVLSLNKTGGNYEEITRKDTYVEAENLFYTKCSQYAPNPATGYVVVELLDVYGRVIKSETIDRLPHPEPATYVQIVDADAVAEAGVTYYVLVDGEYVEDTGVEVGDRVYGKYVRTTTEA